MPDALALAAAFIAAGGKPPVYVDTLAGLYAAYRGHDQDGGPVPNVVLSAAMKKFFDEIEEKRSSEIEHRKETPR